MSPRCTQKTHTSTRVTIHRCIFFGWLCLMSHRQRGHLQTAPPFTVPCEGCEAR